MSSQLRSAWEIAKAPEPSSGVLIAVRRETIASSQREKCASPGGKQLGTAGCRPRSVRSAPLPSGHEPSGQPFTCLLRRGLPARSGKGCHTLLQAHREVSDREHEFMEPMVCSRVYWSRSTEQKPRNRGSMRRIVVGLASVAALALAAPRILSRSMRVVQRVAIEWQQKRKLRRLLRRIGSIRHLEKGIGADRSTTERLLIAVGARKSGKDEWTLHTH
jgi:hypothetical protein